jgi:universal stress protein A
MVMITIKNILVTTDLSHESRSAFEYARWLASKEKAQLTLLYCVDNLPSVAYHTIDLTFDKFRDELLKQEQRRLDNFARLLRKNYKTTFNIVLVEGNASRMITDYAKRKKIDLIVMNTHGRTGISHAMLGSIAEKVVRLAPCPVLTIRSTIASSVSKSKKTAKVKKSTD